MKYTVILEREGPLPSAGQNAEIKGLEPGFGVVCEFTDREEATPVSGQKGKVVLLWGRKGPEPLDELDDSMRLA
jgi:hypothetical protein